MKATYSFLLIASIALALSFLVPKENEKHPPETSESATKNLGQSIPINKIESYEYGSILENTNQFNSPVVSNKKIEPIELSVEYHRDELSKNTTKQNFFEEHTGDGTTTSETEAEPSYSVKEAFESDLNDGRRSFELENKYMAIISESERLSMYAFQEADCKQDNCRIAFWVSDIVQIDELTTDLIQTLLDQGSPINMEFGNINQKGIAEFYLDASDSYSFSP